MCPFQLAAHTTTSLPEAINVHRPLVRIRLTENLPDALPNSGWTRRRLANLVSGGMADLEGFRTGANLLTAVYGSTTTPLGSQLRQAMFDHLQDLLVFEVDAT